MLLKPLVPPVCFFGGKGGVGKTTCAAAIAAATAAKSVKTLLVSTDPAHSLRDVLATPLDLSAPTLVAPGLDALELDPQMVKQRYLADVRHTLERIAPPQFLAEARRQVELAAAAPGATEAALTEALARLLTQAPAGYQQVVIDTAPTGHTLQLLQAPAAMQAWMDGLLARRSEAIDPDVVARLTRRRAHLQAMAALLRDPARAGFVLVTLAEPMALAETVRAHEALDRLGLAPAAVVVNRLTPADAAGAWALAQRVAEAAALRAVRPGGASTPIIRQVARLPRPCGVEALRAVGQSLLVAGLFAAPGNGRG